eukprot:GHRR01004282.1.p1 GENE.GHRR01004282.1~~GHRR01004282.1.p1  ORF type:complete len:220 (+),score=55.70 GHRR01004282.1:305-964(+)
MGVRQLKVKIFNDIKESTLELGVATDATVETVVGQVRAHKGWPSSQNVRLLCAGQELFLDDRISKASSNVLHCIATETAACRASCKQTSKGQHQQHTPPVDWLEVVNPSMVLMWIFGSILAVLWLLLMFCAHMFDKTSVVMLCMMTIVFLIPCVLSYVPWLQALSTLGGGSGSSLTPARQQMYHQYTQQTAQRPAGLSSPAIPPRPAPHVQNATRGHSD